MGPLGKGSTYMSGLEFAPRQLSEWCDHGVFGRVDVDTIWIENGVLLVLDADMRRISSLASTHTMIDT